MEKEKQFFMSHDGIRNSMVRRFVDVLDIVLAPSSARTPTTQRRSTDDVRGVGVADLVMAPGYASTSTPPGDLADAVEVKEDNGTNRRRGCWRCTISVVAKVEGATASKPRTQGEKHAEWKGWRMNADAGERGSTAGKD